MTNGRGTHLALHQNGCVFFWNLGLHRGGHLTKLGEVAAQMTRNEDSSRQSLAETENALCVACIHFVLHSLVFLRPLRHFAERLPVVVDNDADDAPEIDCSIYPIDRVMKTHAAREPFPFPANRLSSLRRRVLPATPHTPSVVITLWFLAND